jgi:hypothetical protein
VSACTYISMHKSPGRVSGTHPVEARARLPEIEPLPEPILSGPPTLF